MQGRGWEGTMSSTPSEPQFTSVFVTIQARLYTYVQLTATNRQLSIIILILFNCSTKRRNFE